MMKCGRSSVLGLVVGLLGAWGASPAIASGICPAELGDRIQTIAARPEFERSRLGILVQTQGRHPQTLYDHDATAYFIAASNLKLLTTAAALEQLGPQFRISTPVYRENRADGIVLRVVGHGDPSITDTELGQLAEQVRRSLRETSAPPHIHQLIAVDRSVDDAVNSGWEWEDIQAGYGAPVNSLILNQNQIGLTLVPQQVGQPLQVVWDDPTEASRWRVENRSITVTPQEAEFLDVGRDLSRPLLRVSGQLRAGSASEPVAVAIPQPAQYFLHHFQQALAAAHISVAHSQVDHGPDRSSPESHPRIDGGEAIATLYSPPLATLIQTANQDSNNLYAEALLRQLGAINNQPVSLEAGISAMTPILTRLGVDPDGYVLADGSGLSRRSWASPTALVQTLQAMARSPYGPAYRASLSVAGVNGTLRHRFQNTPVEGQLWGKTGYLTGAVSLSGYLTPPDYDPMVFSIIVNQAVQPVQASIDDIVELLSRLSRC